MPDIAWPEFAWAWALLALPLPWLAMRFLPAAPRRLQAALQVPYARAFAAMHASTDPSRRLRLRRWLPLLGWALLCVAAARPQQLGDIVQPPYSGRDLLLAVDLSGSMQQQDMRLGGEAVDRLTAIKAVLGDFLSRRVGDRVGLIVFGTQAYAVTPLTYDRETVRQQLLTSEVGLAGPNTAIGDAIVLAAKRLRAQPQQDNAASTHVLILLTDGVSNAGAVEPLKAAGLAASEHLRIYTIGFGGDGQVDPLMGFALPVQDDTVDETTLRTIAQRTGGRYFRARDAESLAGIYAELDRVEPSLHEGRIERPRTELYPWPLAVALLIGILLIGVPALQPLRRVA
ncbi:MAG TPA: VWA domain-containing protein [Xanthomonadaceae bacterium]|nr:VWA domain-containing protein [Xanthomonadaceae bacterium]